ncbi:MAG: 16S rRNA (cytidine(1402)-2'-O)-methyltransferase [Ignavibacteriales bacterium]|nr:16S rRNA (cytidine(1402)-2'-O)-methyltransferase [Ignavibacteriales bacterium]
MSGIGESDRPFEGQRRSQEELRKTAGTLYIVATPIGNLEDISSRAVKVLSSVDLIAAEDTRKSKILLDHYRISKPMLSYFSYNEKARAPQLIEKLLAGQSVALISDAGTPGISDPAYHVVTQAIANRIPIVPIPGPSAFLSALIVSGLDMRGFAYEGFLPQKKGRKTRLESLKTEPRTIVFYESPYRVLKTLKEIHETWGDRKIVVCRELTKKFEEIVRGRVSSVLKELSKKPTRGEYVILVGGSPS